MKIILREDVPPLGGIGDVVDVSAGYARNYLVPRKLAVAADEKNLRQLDHEKRMVQRRRDKLQFDARSFADKIAATSVTVPVSVGEQDKLYGSVTALDIEEAAQAEGLNIDRKQIVLDDPIKELGVYGVDVKLHKDVVAKLKVWVVSK
jgi:large subunit ribosomal protein L9